MTEFGTHWLWDLFDCDAHVLNDLETIRTVLEKTAQAAGATIVGRTFHQFTPVGVTGVLILAESHLAIHTWPERRYAAVDFFSCNSAMRLADAEAILKNGMCATSIHRQERLRGLLPQTNVE